MTAKQFDKIVRTNRGYWDGVSASKTGRYPVWAKGWLSRQVHPFDKLYGAGFWMGFYGEPAPPYALTGEA